MKSLILVTLVKLENASIKMLGKAKQVSLRKLLQQPHVVVCTGAQSVWAFGELSQDYRRFKASLCYIGKSLFQQTNSLKITMPNSQVTQKTIHTVSHCKTIHTAMIVSSYLCYILFFIGKNIFIGLMANLGCQLNTAGKREP